MRLILIIILFLNIGNCFSQHTDSLKYIDINNDILIKPNTLSTHPFGLFLSRINHDFKIMPVNKYVFTFNVSNGNVWLPYLEAYKPIDESDRQLMSEMIWYHRLNEFDPENSPNEFISFHADGVYRVYQLRLDIPLRNNQDLQFNLRAFSFDRGRFPFSTWTSDKFIEDFHTNVYGGDDPFARRVYGFDKAELSYMDENGNSLQLAEGDFMIPGLDVSYHFYPRIPALKRRNIYTNIGFQLGGNISRINPTMDLAYVITGVKKIDLKKERNLSIGLSFGLLHQDVIRFGEGVRMINNDLLFSSELFLIYKKYLKNNRFVSIAANYFVQSSFNKKEEFDYIVIIGEWKYSTHWHYAFTHLYRALDDYSIIFTYGIDDFAFSLFMREDRFVDNAPDVQTGIEINIAF